MSYTVRLTIQIRQSRRLLKTFLRPESALNTSSHADRFATIEEAEAAADRAGDTFGAAGHTYIGADFYQVPEARL